jgi:four helix bundle protein
MGNKKPIRSFKDLEVYNLSYQAMLDVFKYILPKLPAEEKYDLRDQLSRSSKSIPRLIAEGYAKRHQKKGFQKYLDDAMGESNETGVSITQARDLYFSSLEVKICNKLIDTYDKISRQCYNLAIAWNKFDDRKLMTKPIDD